MPDNVCGVSECENRHRGSGFCVNHADARFWSQVDKNQPNGCWLWTGAINTQGYGVMGIGKRSQVYCHRYAYEKMMGPIPGSATLDHLCRNRACCNPNHLEPCSRGENVLRGIGFAAENAKKTHCPRGHPYDSANTHINKRGHRICRACARERMREKARKAREGAA